MGHTLPFKTVLGAEVLYCCDYTPYGFSVKQGDILLRRAPAGDFGCFVGFFCFTSDAKKGFS